MKKCLTALFLLFSFTANAGLFSYDGEDSRVPSWNDPSQSQENSLWNNTIDSNKPQESSIWNNTIDERTSEKAGWSFWKKKKNPQKQVEKYQKPQKSYYEIPYQNPTEYDAFSHRVHHRYIEPEREQPVINIPEDRIKERKYASDNEIALLQQYYRHVNVLKKIEPSRYITISAMYFAPFKVHDFASRLHANNAFDDVAISQFAKQYKENVSNSGDITLDSRNFGFSASFGQKLNYSVFSEWHLFLFQGTYLGDSKFNGGNTNFTVTYKDNNQEITVNYPNAEYIQTTFGVHYNLVKEFREIFSDSSNITVRHFIPYLSGGLGLASQYEFLRLSQGVIGLGDISGGYRTKTSYFAIRPSFNLNAGLVYKINSSVALDVKLSTYQIFTDITMNKYTLQVGGRFYF